MRDLSTVGSTPLWIGVLLLFLTACAQIEEQPSPRPTPAPVDDRDHLSPGSVVGANADMVVYLPQAGDSWQSLAARFLGDASLGWVLEQTHGTSQPTAGSLVTVPLRVPAAVGIYREGIQLITVLCYHRIGDRAAKMTVTPGAFKAQMRALRDHGYSVVRLADLMAFLDGKRPLPAKSVVITFDDGYESTFEDAYPILREMNFPATVFLYTDFVGAADALSWPQMAEMTRSGLVDIQPHSKTHISLTHRGSGESETTYLNRLREELQVPRTRIESQLGTQAEYFAYPYGDADTTVVREVRATRYHAAFTVHPGGNPFFAHRYAIKRTMVFGEDDLKSFLGKLAVFERRERY